MNYLLSKLKGTLIVVFMIAGCLLPAFSESHLKITGVAGSKAPDVPLADTSMPDIVLDASLAGDVNVDISTLGVPDGTKVKVQVKDEINDEINTNPPEGIVESGMSTVLINLKAGNAKVIYAETAPYVPFITKSATGGKLDADSGTVGLYHLDSDVLDASPNGNHLTYYPGWEAVQYVDGVNSSSKGIYFWSKLNTYENRRVHRYGNPNGSGFTSIPKQWSAEFAIKPLRDIGNEKWYPFLIQDQNIITYTFLGTTPWGWGEAGKYSIYHIDAKGASNSIQIPNPFEVNKWTYITLTHDGHIFKLYINGIEKGSVISDGNFGVHPWDNYGVCAGAIFNSPDWISNPSLAVDEIRVSNIVRNREELANNAQELLGTGLRARTLLASKTSDKTLKLVTSKKDKTKTKKGKLKKEIRHQVINTTSAQEGEVKTDKDTVALFHFNGTTKDSVSKKALLGDPETTSFEEGKNGNDISSVSLEGQDDLLLVNKKLFDGNPKEWTVDFFSKPNIEALFPSGILTIDNGQIFAMVSYAKTFEGKTILSASSFDANGKPVVIGAEAEFSQDKWTHIALVYKDKKLQFLVNGKSYGEADLLTLYKKGDGAINVGSDGGDGIFNGQIDELRISDIARSQIELEVYAKR